LADLHACNPSEVMLIACRIEKARYSVMEANRLWCLARRLASSGNRVRPYLAYREPMPPWALFIEEIIRVKEIKHLAWKPDEKELPPWYEEEK